jgi:hypothetical protein
MTAAEIMKAWPDEAREAAQAVVDAYGEPQESTPSVLIWYSVGSWKRVIASKVFYRHEFPAPHNDSVESVVDYRVPAAKFSELAEFDGSVVVERTAGEVSARCHDEQANSLALNLMHDIVTGAKTTQQAREYYAQEFLDFRRKKPTPYMDGLRFTPAAAGAADPDFAVLTDADLQQAVKESEHA